MDILTENQKILADYLRACEMPLRERLLAVAKLWEEEATMEMLQYILETEESDWTKLLSTALKISQKYQAEETEETED